jgi:aminopeptidase N
VVDTDATFLNFDGITYGKGASVLKQLMAVVGEDGFKAGMVHYFKKHEWGNTTIRDFLLALEHGYNSIQKDQKIDLLGWSKYWLEAAVRSLTLSFSFSKLTNLHLKTGIEHFDPFL